MQPRVTERQPEPPQPATVQHATPSAPPAPVTAATSANGPASPTVSELTSACQRLGESSVAVIMPLPTLADGSVRTLDPAWPSVDAISWWILTAIALITGGVAITIVWASGEVDPPILAGLITTWVVIVGLLTLGAVRWPHLAYRRTHYIVSPQGIEIRRGVIWRSVTHVPRSRVQHTDVTQGPIMRRYNLATLVMHTAGTHYAIVALPGLSHEVAMQLRDFLIRGSTADAV